MRADAARRRRYIWLEECAVCYLVRIHRPNPKSVAEADTYWLSTDRCAEELPGQAFLPWPWSVGLETRAPRREEEMEWAH